MLRTDSYRANTTNRTVKVRGSFYFVFIFRLFYRFLLCYLICNLSRNNGLETSRSLKIHVVCFFDSSHCGLRRPTPISVAAMCITSRRKPFKIKLLSTMKRGKKKKLVFISRKRRLTTRPAPVIRFNYDCILYVYYAFRQHALGQSSRI